MAHRDTPGTAGHRRQRGDFQRLSVDNQQFSLPEIRDLTSRVTSVTAFGDFSVTEFTMVGLGEPRRVRAGAVGGLYFEVMGLRPAIGRPRALVGVAGVLTFSVGARTREFGVRLAID